jgi:hypothetical protein
MDGNGDLALLTDGGFRPLLEGQPFGALPVLTGNELNWLRSGAFNDLTG